MGIYPQPNLWQCGPFALKHALVTLGIFAEEDEITSIAGTRWWEGTDEIQLSRAARQFGCTLMMFRRFTTASAKRELISYLRKGIPVLLCVYDWSHWITVVKESKGKFIALDSKDKSVLTILSWRELNARWVFKEVDDMDKTAIHMKYDFHPVVPRSRVHVRARFSLRIAKLLRRPENKTLSHYWDEYLADLVDLCKPRTALSENVISLGTFFRRHEAMILQEVAFWHGNVRKEEARKLLRHLHFVADTYGLVIHEEDEKRAIAGITALLTLWASHRYGVNRVYDSKIRL